MPFNSKTASAAGKKGGAAERKTKDPTDIRGKRFAITISQEEYDAITLKAAALRMSKADLVVKAVNDYSTGSYAEMLRNALENW